MRGILTSVGGGFFDAVEHRHQRPGRRRVPPPAPSWSLLLGTLLVIFLVEIDRGASSAVTHKAMVPDAIRTQFGFSF